MSDRVIQFPVKKQTTKEPFDLKSLRSFCYQSISDLNRVLEAIDGDLITQEVLEVMLIHTGYDIEYSLEDEEYKKTDAKILASVEKNNSKEQCLKAFGEVELFLALEAAVVLKSLDEEREVRLDELNMVLDILLDEPEEEEGIELCGYINEPLCSDILVPVAKEPVKVLKMKNKIEEDLTENQDALIETLGDLLDEAKSGELSRFMYIKGNLDASLKLEYGISGRWISPIEMLGAVAALNRKVQMFADEYEDLE
jgi:hypothetical protein